MIKSMIIAGMLMYAVYAQAFPITAYFKTSYNTHTVSGKYVKVCVYTAQGQDFKIILPDIFSSCQMSIQVE